MEATTRVRISPSAFDFLFLCSKKLSFEKRADFISLIANSKAESRASVADSSAGFKTSSIGF